MTRNQIEQILNEIGANLSPHSGRKLIEHLLGTYDYLVQWSLPDHVCVAGAFHSIYGTNVYTNKTLTYKDRPFVKELIGDLSENLVFLFSRCNRPKDIEAGKLYCRVKGNEIHADQLIIEELRAIEIANLIEQKVDLNTKFPTLYQIYNRLQQNER